MGFIDSCGEGGREGGREEQGHPSLSFSCGVCQFLGQQNKITEEEEEEEAVKWERIEMMI